MGRGTVMMSSKAAWGALLLLTSRLALCVDPYPVPSQYCMLACQFSFATQLFVGNGKSSDIQRCNNVLYVESTALCAAKFCTRAEIEAGSGFLDAICEDAGEEKPLVGDAIGRLNASQIVAAKVLKAGAKKATQNTTMIPDQQLLSIALLSASFRGDNRATNDRYANALYIFWGIVLGIGTLHNVLQRVSLPKNLSMASHFGNSIRAYLILPFTLPSFGSRISALTLLAYFVINIVLCAVGINAYPQSLYFASFSLQVWGLVARRLATVGLANIPIVLIFGIRNNLLIYLTGWEFATFNRFHRWIARIATLQLLLHGICFTGFEFDKGGPARYLSMYTNTWWNMGIAATVLLCFNVLLVSTLWLRNHFYDAFLLLHIVFGVAILITIYYHVEMWHGIFTPYVWAAVGIWAFDRVARFARVGTLLIFSSSSNARIEYDTKADILRVDVSSFFAGSSIKPAPGAYYYIYTPARLLGWESHPFTLVAWPPSTASTVSASKPTEMEKDAQAHFNGASTTSSSSAASTSSSPTSTTDTAYSFLIRPQAGFTSRLKPATTSGSNTSHAHTRILLEGPYGAHRGPPMHRYRHILILCGGSGISVGIAAIHNALHTTPNNVGATPKIKLVWALREAAMLESVAKRELAGALAASKTGAVTLDAFVTQSAQGDGNLDLGGEYIRGRSRPDLARILHASAVALEHNDKGAERLAVVACGPAQMTDEVRAAVAELVKRGKAMDLFAEHFGW